jgi:hypothetical protein
MMFGTQLVYGNPATSLATDGNLHEADLALRNPAAATT